MTVASKVPASTLVEMMADARRRTLDLVADLADEQLSVPLLEVVNPFRWELGHVAFFYDVFLLRELGADEFLLPHAEKLYDSFRVDHDDRWNLPLPSRTETLEYLRRVYEEAAERLDSHEPTAEESYLYLLCILHEDMHGEAFTYMRQTLEYPVPELHGLLPAGGAARLVRVSPGAARASPEGGPVATGESRSPRPAACRRDRGPGPGAAPPAPPGAGDGSVRAGAG